MSRFRKLSQTICAANIPLYGSLKPVQNPYKPKVAEEVENRIRAFSEQEGCEIMELSVQAHHVHLLALVPPKVSISSCLGTLRGRATIRVFN